MKKALLLATAALLSATAAFAGTKYVPASAGIKSPDELQHEGLYILHAHFNTTRERQGLLTGRRNATEQFVRYAGSNYTAAIPESEVANNNELWKVHITDNGFALQCVGADGRFISKDGARGEAWNNVKSTTSLTDTKTALYELAEIDPATTNNYSTDDHHRFWVRLTNGNWSNPNSGDPNVKPCLMSNGPVSEDGNAENLAYWDYDTEKNYNGYLQIEFVPVEVVTTTSQEITVNFPQINGQDVPAKHETLDEGVNVTSTINGMIEDLGGMSNVQITGQDGSLVVSENNKVFTVTGDWNHAFIPNYVYRIMVKPTDKPGSMRYDVLNNNIPTTQDYGVASLSRLVPERLWYFQPVEGKDGVYTLHTMANRDLGVTIGDTESESDETRSYASLTDTPTEFTIVPSTWNNALPGDIVLKYGQNGRNYVNDRDNFFSHWTSSLAQSNDGSALRLYPLTDADFDVLASSSNVDETEVEEAKKDPTAENIADIINGFNEVNLTGALRRISYIGGVNGIGENPGQYNNENGDFMKFYEEALALSESGSTDDDAIKAAIANIDESNLTVFHDLIPGRFYRFKSKLNGKYMSSISSKSDNDHDYMDLAEDGTRSNTVWYYGVEGENNVLISFDEGLVMPKFLSTSKSTWCPVLKTDEANVATDINIAFQNNGCFIIHVDSPNNGHRHLYSGNHNKIPGAVLASGNATSDDHQWLIETVNELPIPLYGLDVDSNKGWGSIHSPVQLEITDGSVIVNSAKFTGSSVEKQVLGNGKIIPANTTVLLDYQGDGGADPSTVRDNISYIYAKVKYDAAAVETAMYYDGEATEETAAPKGKDLNGGYYAIDNAEDTNYFTLHETTSNKFRLYDTDGEKGYIPGFKAHIAVPATEALPESGYYEIVDPKTVAIDNIEAENAGVKVVYDLQGRKLAAPVKGINIINGQKVLVK